MKIEKALTYRVKKKLTEIKIKNNIKLMEVN